MHAFTCSEIIVASSNLFRLAQLQSLERRELMAEK